MQISSYNRLKIAVLAAALSVFGRSVLADTVTISPGAVQPNNTQAAVAAVRNQTLNQPGPAVSAKLVTTANVPETSAAIETTSNSGYWTFLGENSGLGPGGWFKITSAQNTNIVLQATTEGFGTMGYFQSTNAGNFNPTVQALNLGTGQAGSFVINHQNSGNAALAGSTNGTNGVGVAGMATGAGFFAAGVSGNGLNGPGVFGCSNGNYGGYFKGFSGIYSNAIDHAGSSGIAGYFVKPDGHAGAIVTAVRQTTGGAITIDSGFGYLGTDSVSGQPIQTGIYGNAIANNTIGGLFNSPSSTNVHSAFQASYNGTGAAMYANNNHPSQGAAGQFVNTFVGATTPGNRGGALLAENRAALFNPSLYENGSLTQPRYDPNNDSSKWAYAAEFQGDVKINGFINGNHPASAPMKMFLIDHPLDPANKTLMHSVVESPDVKNIYDGVVTTDKSGDAVVQLPDYFEALNRDYRYQLTCLGQFAQAIVSKKVANNQFQIQTDEPNVEVSWQITGIRQDAYVKAHPFEPEKIKSEADRGKYLYPREAGVDPKLEIGYDPDAQARRAAVQVNLDLSSPGVAAANPTGGVVLQSTSAPTPSGKRPSPRIPSNGSRTTRR